MTILYNHCYFGYFGLTFFNQYFKKKKRNYILFSNTIEMKYSAGGGGGGLKLFKTLTAHV